MFLKSILQATAVVSLLSTVSAGTVARPLAPRASSTSSSSTTACNNSPSLCSKAYNNITHLGAHDAAFVRDKSTQYTTAGDQYFDAVTALEAGVRLLTAQVHKANGSDGSTEWHLCHSSCSLLDAGKMSDWLKNISSWMDSNPNDVVTVLIVNSDSASATTIGQEFKTSGIDKYAYTPSSSSAMTTWPTLQTLISNNTRLMTFIASMNGTDSNYPYLMDEFTYIFENDYNNNSPSDFSCTANRPSDLSGQTTQALSSGRMFFMNHFLYSTQLFGIQTPNVTYINTTNAETGTGSLGESIKSCTSTYSKAPTFVLVDFFSVGPAISSVDTANGVTDATGRKSLTTALLEEDTSTSGVDRRRGSMLAVVIAVVVAVAFGS